MSSPRVGATLIDLGGFTVSLPPNTPLAFSHGFELESLIGSSYPTLVCVFDKVNASLVLREKCTCKRLFNKKYRLVIDHLKDDATNPQISRVVLSLRTNVAQYNAVAKAGGSIVKLLLMPESLQQQYIYRYIDLDGSIKSKKKEKAWMSLKLGATGGTLVALVLGILAAL